MRGLVKVVLAVAAIVFGVLCLASGHLFGLSPLQFAGLSGACAGGAVLL